MSSEKWKTDVLDWQRKEEQNENIQFRLVLLPA